MIGYFKKLICLLPLIFYHPEIFAYTPAKNDMNSPFFSSMVITLSGGPLWAKGGRSQTFFLAPEIEKTYAAHHLSERLTYEELFLGIQKILGEKLTSQLGLVAARTDDNKISGEIWDDADPQFNNYIYDYRIKHSHLALKGTLLMDVNCIVLPFVNASVGVAYNHAHRFTNTPVIPEAIINPNFLSHTQTSFTYTIGAGLEFIVAKHWQAGLAYQFADWGKSQLGRAFGQTLNHGISLSHLYTNELLFNISYLT